MRTYHLHIMLLAALLLGLLPGLTSCSQKEILFPEAGMAVLDVRFGWPEALTEKPRGMTLWFFSLEDDGLIWRFDIAGSDGGPVELPYGEYTMVSCSNDVAAIRITDTSDPLSLTASLEATDSIAPAITPLYRALAESISFTPGSLRWTEDGVDSERPGMFPTLLCHPAKVSTGYDIELRDIQGLERMKTARLRFHGVCRDLMLYDAHSHGQVLDFPAVCDPPAAGTSLLATFESFGPLPDIDEASVEVTVTLKDRRVYRKSFDVADQLANLRDRFDVKIVIEGLSIPDDGEPPDDDVGMEVGVDGWTEINIDYTTGP